MSDEKFELTEDEKAIMEKWGKDVEIHKTGEHAGKTIAQLKKEIKNLRGKPGNKEKMGELLFALRAKEGWKKKTGVAQEQLDMLNITEKELSDLLNFIYESENHPEKDLYARFIKEDATLDQKFGLLETLVSEVKDPNKQGHLGKATVSAIGGLTGPFYVAYRLIRALTDKCSRKCSVIGTNTFMRQKCMAGCKAQEATKAAAAVNKIVCKGDAKCEEKKKALKAKWMKKAEEAKAKHQRYEEKHKKLAFTL